MNIAENIQAIKLKISEIEKKYQRKPNSVQLIAVSKTHPSDAVLEALKAGQLDFGENKVQELCQKAEELPKNIRWHLIGHLQTNKVKLVLPHVYMIHSVDSVKLLTEIQKQAYKINKTINILLQINISNEAQKSGMLADEAENIFSSIEEFPNIKINGFMGIAEECQDTVKLINQFSILLDMKRKFENIEHKQLDLKELSMGMSGDFEEAIASGSTMIRVGSAIFGNRDYL